MKVDAIRLERDPQTGRCSVTVWSPEHLMPITVIESSGDWIFHMAHLGSGPAPLLSRVGRAIRRFFGGA